MKLEIDIPSILYNDAKENRNYISLNKLEIAWKAIADGKPLEQEPVLDKVRAEIEQLSTYDEFTGESYFAYKFKSDALCVIDKYKAESEG